MRAVSLIEPLEDRIAPAAIPPVVTLSDGGKVASYTDTNGDRVFITTSKGAFSNQPSDFTFSPDSSQSSQLTELNLFSNSAFNGANLTFSIIPGATGQGTSTLNVGFINAEGVNLSSVTVPGDLGSITVGGGPTQMALGALNVKTLGALTTTQTGINVTTVSNIFGTVGTVNVSGNLDGTLFVQDYNSHPGTGNIQHLFIGGSLDGNTQSGTGDVFFSGLLNTAVVMGGIEGGSTNFSGSIAGYDVAGVYSATSKINSVSVLGTVPDDPNPQVHPGAAGTSILGGAGGLSGGIGAATVQSVTVAGNVFGGTGAASGFVQGGNNLANAVIEGSLIGGNSGSQTSSAATSGFVFGGNIGSVTIEQDILGGSGVQSGNIFSTGTIQNVTVMGSLFGGSAGTSANAGLSGAIRAHVLGNVVIKGALLGGNLVAGDANQTGNTNGVIASDTTIASISIGKNLVGGSGFGSGQISTTSGEITKLVIGAAGGAYGSILGGSGGNSGFLSIGGTLGQLDLAHNLAGGAGSGSGTIQVNGPINSMDIGGSVIGGTTNFTGTISVFGLLDHTTIHGNVIGSSSGAAKLTNTGYIQADGIGALAIDGSLIAGHAGSGGLDTSGAIRSTVSIANLTIGNLIGNTSNPAIISAVGLVNQPSTAKTDVAIQSITVKGFVNYSDILAGYDTDTQNGAAPLGTGVSADAQIGTVVVDGSYRASNIIAGVRPGSAGFGTAGSSILSGSGVMNLPSIISKISSVIINGQVLQPVGTANHYGIAAQYIASASYLGAKVALAAGADNDTFAKKADHPLGSNGNVILYEV